MSSYRPMRSFRQNSQPRNQGFMNRPYMRHQFNGRPRLQQQSPQKPEQSTVNTLPFVNQNKPELPKVVPKQEKEPVVEPIEVVMKEPEIKASPIKESPVKELPIKESPGKELPIKESPIKEPEIKEPEVVNEPQQKVPIMANSDNMIIDGVKGETIPLIDDALAATQVTEGSQDQDESNNSTRKGFKTNKKSKSLKGIYSTSTHNDTYTRKTSGKLNKPLRTNGI